MPTIVTLTTVWLNLVSDPTVTVSFSNMAKLTVDKAIQGEVRRYAGGRTRVVTKAGVTRTVALELPACDRTQIDWLTAHIGELVCARDDYGRKVFGAYLSVPVEELRYTRTYGNVTISLAEVSHTGAV